MSWVWVCSGAAKPAGSLKRAPNVPAAGLPHSGATLTPGAPGSRSAHFMSPAGMTTSRLTAGSGAGFAIVVPDPCARTDTVEANVITSVKTLLALIQSSLSLLHGLQRGLVARDTSHAADRPRLAAIFSVAGHPGSR